MKCAASFLVTTLAMIASLPAADGTPASNAPPTPVLSNSPTRRLPLVVHDLSLVATAHLFVTSNGGATWQKAQELVPVPSEEPRFTFTASSDGVYGFASAVTFKDGHREPEPRPGQVPQLLIQIDTTPPTIDRFSARVESLVDGQLAVRFGWAVSDALPAEQPVSLDVSSDGGATFAPLQRGPAQGNLTISIPAPTAGHKAAVRLRAADKAGNLSLSAVSILDAPAASTPAPVITDSKALAAALASLPTIELPPAPARAATPATSVTAAPEPTAPPAPEPVTPSTPLVPVAAPPAVTTEKPVVEDVETLHGTGMDQEYRQALVEQNPTAKPAWQETKERPAQAAPVAPLFPVGIPPSGSLTPSQAQNLLVSAREAHLAGDNARSLRFYRRLRDSTVASQSLPEELRLMRETNRVAEGLAIASALPAAQHYDAVLIEHGRLLIAAGRAHDALVPLARVRAGTPQSAEGLFVIAQALAADGKADQAKKVYTAVAKGSGPWAQAAQQQLAGR